MEPERKIGNHHRARFGAAQGHLVVGLGVGSWRVQADDRQPLGSGPAQALAPEVERAAHDDQVDAGRRQGLVQVGGRVDLREFVAAESGTDGQQVMLGMVQEPLRPVPFLVPVAHNQNIHYDVIAPGVPVRPGKRAMAAGFPGLVSALTDLSNARDNTLAALEIDQEDQAVSDAAPGGQDGCR